MSPEATCRRAMLGALTSVLVLYITLVRDGRLVDDRQFWAVVVTLAVLCILAVDIQTPLFEGFEAQVNDLTSLPWKLYDTIAPGMEKLTGAIRGDSGSVDQATTDLTKSLYADQVDAGSLHAADGSVDDAKFAAMKLEYKRIVVFLCRMKALAPAAHDAVVTAMGAC